jgi:hypothetical protein
MPQCFVVSQNGAQICTNFMENASILLRFSAI